MPPQRDVARRGELLDALIDAFAAGGIGGRSLRDLAEAVGTSHRMLIHHFGSRDELMIAIVQEVERRQTLTLDRLPEDPAAAFLAMWADLARPELRPFERLFFECYARGCQAEAPFDRLVPDAVHGWLSAVDDRSGGAADAAIARLGLAVTRGLLLDLVATDDVAGVTAAAESFAALLSRGDAARRGSAAARSRPGRARPPTAPSVSPAAHRSG
jgi:AcrR family transcriptional regulator